MSNKSKKEAGVNADQFQQGDVILRRLDAMPEGKAKVVSKGRCVVAHGESGHSHVIDAPESEAELIQIGERMILSLKSEQTLTHEEHKTQTYAPGLYDVGRVNEYDYFTEMTRKVAD
jgi:hypothetical protein